jgi:hypothetical protein
VDAQQEQQEQQVPPVELFPQADMRKRDERAAALHGRLVVKKLTRGQLWGVLNFKGAAYRPKYFRAVFANGSIDDDLTHTVITGKRFKVQPVGKQPPKGVKLPDPEPEGVL